MRLIDLQKSFSKQTYELSDIRKSLSEKDKILSDQTKKNADMKRQLDGVTESFHQFQHQVLAHLASLCRQIQCDFVKENHLIQILWMLIVNRWRLNDVNFSSL